MNKKGVILFFILLGVLFITFNNNNYLKEKIFILPDTIRSILVNIGETLLNSFNEHRNQEKEIKRLKEELKVAKKLALLSVAYKKRLNQILEENNLTKYQPSLKLVQAKAYVRLSDYNKIWLEFGDFDKNKIYGLIKNNYTAGIVVAKNAKPMALLQGDSMCSFSVVIGKEQVPGIIFGNKKEMIIKFIPPWMSLKVGDEVSTSGLDNIFYEGVKVGKVIKISDEESYKTAIVQPYHLSNTIPSFYHIIDTDIANADF